MRRHKRSIWTNAFFSTVTAAICGLVFTSAASLLLGMLLLYVMRNMKLAGGFARAALVFGAYAGSYIYGKCRRRRGPLGGSLCGAVMYAMLSIAGIIFAGSPSGIKKLLLLVIAGGAGGVAGVNSKRPKNLMDQ